MDLIIGNLCSLFATIADVFSTSRKKVRDFLLFQCIGQAFYLLGTLVLKGYSAAVQNAVCILRNLAAVKNIKSKVLEWALVVIALVLGLVFNNMGWLGLLPVVANFQYSLAVFRFKDREVPLKISFLLNVVMYMVFNFAIRNYVGSATNAFLIFSTIWFLVKHQKEKEKEVEV